MAQLKRLCRRAHCETGGLHQSLHAIDVFTTYRQQQSQMIWTVVKKKKKNVDRVLTHVTHAHLCRDTSDGNAMKLVDDGTVKIHYSMYT